MSPQKIGVLIESMSSVTEPTALLSGDIYGCDRCGFRIATQFGESPVLEPWQDGYYVRRNAATSRFWKSSKDRKL